MQAKLALALMFVVSSGCVAKVGERCDGFFSNGCNAPASCIQSEDQAVCARGCGMNDSCDDGFTCVQVMVETGPGSGAPMGGYCLPNHAVREVPR